MKILIINQPAFNRGDESAHKALIRSLLAQYANAEIRVLSLLEKKESTRQYAIGDKRVKYIFDPPIFLLWNKLLRSGMLSRYYILWRFHPIFRNYKGIYKWADFVICAPGGICMGGFQNWYHLFHLKFAKIFHKPLLYFGRSFGPFPTETKSNCEFKRLSMEMLGYFSYLSIRDHKTEILAKELGFPYISTVDTAFLDSSIIKMPYEINRFLGEGDYMVFVPNYLVWHYTFKGKLSHEEILSFYCEMIDVIFNNYPSMNMVMLPQLFGGETYSMTDVAFFRDIAEKKQDRRIMVLPDSYSSDVQQAIIKKSKFVIGARYHSIVFAINQGVPFISLSYEHKMIGLLETLEMTDYCVEITDRLLTGKQTEILSMVDEILKKGFGDMAEAQSKAKFIADNGIKELFKCITNLKK